ncbi:hypothetical protein PVAP13_9NG551328 [Panicum virgatum]|uniref:Uncharacterized protein n=1 Tax=Panicum virgatum TaxID=38727 RepID=A0A8T0MV20_PANVG|nr:hypothetical protein PVAP13_9NG551328 [Panicum virgatum]
MDLLSSCGRSGAAEDEVVDLKVLVPAGFERRLDLPDRQDVLPDPLHCHPSVLDGRQDLNLPPPAALAAAPRRRQRPQPRSEPLTWSAPLSAKELVADTRGQPQSPQKASGAMRATAYARDFTRGSCGHGAGSRDPPRLHP